MYDGAIALIQENVVLQFKSESPITTANKKKLKCSLYARQGELIFLHTADRMGSVLKALKFLLVVGLVAAYFLSEQLELSEDMVKMFLYAGFAIYAIVPKILKRRKNELTPENLEKLDFEGQITRIYWRELLSTQAPSRVKAAFFKPAEFDQGYQTLMVTMNENSYHQAVGIAKGDYVVTYDEEEL